MQQVQPQKWELFTHGGRQGTGIDAVEFAKKIADMGAGEILLTSMDKDGTKSGFNLDLTKKISSALKIPVIASGGVGNLSHLVDGIKLGGASAVLAASIFHFGEYTIEEAKNASEAFCSSATTFIGPVVEIDNQKIGDGKPGEKSLKLREIYIEESIKSAM